MDKNNPPRCKWCLHNAVRNDYREIDGVTSKILTCDFCFNKSTEYLLKYKNRGCENCSLNLDKTKDGRCELDLKDKCITNTRDENHKEYWIDQDE
jgi:hypothetical protein